jgi:DNA-binding CsgD family transcriptional regulator
MFNGLMVGLFLAAAAAPIVLGARLFRREPSLGLLFYLLYLTLWNFQIVFVMNFLHDNHQLPNNGRLGFLLFNAILLIPIQAATTIFFADFLWKQLGRRLAWTAKMVLAAPFIVVLVTYGRQTALRLAGNPTSSSFRVNALLSTKILIMIVFVLCGYAILIAAVRKDADGKKCVMSVAGLTAMGMILGILLMAWNSSDLLSNILSGFIWVTMNIPAFIAFVTSHQRTQLLSTGRGAPVSRLQAIGERFGLSDRERQVLDLVYRGRLNKEIAGELHISLDTVKRHVYNIFKKTAVRNRLQLFLLLPSEESSGMSGNEAAEGQDRIPN